MIVTQTPLRISFFGGGTDFRGFYAREEGCVLSSAIDKYIFVILKRRFDEKIRVGYTQTELVVRIDDLQHELVRESLRLTGVDRQVEISTMGDIPARGSGLGSSSTVTVGLLNAMYTHLNRPQTQETLAWQACQVEIEKLHKPIGKQDQYIAAYGGLRFIRFLADERVILEQVNLTEQDRRRFSQNLMLFYTNMARSAETVLAEQVNNIDSRFATLQAMKEAALRGRGLLESGDFEGFGWLLHDGWELKKQMASGISNLAIDEMYGAARRAGALGGKLTGAGGGGFLLLFCPVERQPRVRTALSGLRELPLHLEPDGTKVILNYRR